MILTVQVTRQLALEVLAAQPRGQLLHVVVGVATRFAEKSGAQMPSGLRSGDYYDHVMSHTDREKLYLNVQQLLWQLLAQGVLVWGMDSSNANYPFYRLTDYGVSVVAAARPQPYDPDGFFQEFDRRVPNADLVVREYFEEAVRAFNANCYRSAAVMLGGASEKAMLLLHDQFGNAITDAGKKAAFDRASSGISIHKKYSALKDCLDKMVAARKFADRSLVESIGSELPSMFEIIRRFRNSAGHPELSGGAAPDTTFINIRAFVEHARRVQELTAYFSANAADW